MEPILYISMERLQNLAREVETPLRTPRGYSKFSLLASVTLAKVVPLRGLHFLRIRLYLHIKQRFSASCDDEREGGVIRSDEKLRRVFFLLFFSSEIEAINGKFLTSSGSKFESRNFILKASYNVQTFYCMSFT